VPHFKCVACKTRLDSTAGPADLVDDLCPGCRSPLEPVGELAEIVGFRAIKPRDAALAEAALDAERWLDDGGSFSPEAVAAETALPATRRTHPPITRLEIQP
jgi:hypothetical protein